MIIYHEQLLRPELLNIPNQELIRNSQFSQAKPTKLLPQLRDDMVIWLKNLGVKKEDLYSVHSKDYVDDWFTTNPVTAQYALATVNAHYYAAQLAVKRNTNVVTPVSGFHHANYDNGWGFCVFNGLMYSAKRLLDTYPDLHVVIIDGDTHEGDGCLDIIKKLDMKRVLYYSAETGYEKILKNLPDQCIIFYQAGVDGHVDDPFGGEMTDADYEQREKVLLGSNRPIVTNLAGGYTDHAIDLHLATMKRFDYGHRKPWQSVNEVSRQPESVHADAP